ncbi:helicase HerA-like domain-containing protein [Sorangium sp. So ce204]|uniref:helicase HerA-like domain-containing protein n=1 Tax=Sorangium sp. So ce204 TaxID=3133288 RepID=UPI003F5F8E20
MPTRPFTLGRSRPLSGDPGAAGARPFELPAHHLVTHGVVVGMTGSGKTGLVMVLVEEALRSGVPVLMVDVKGDLPNLLFTFPELSAAEFEPWIDPSAAARDGRSTADVAEGLAARWRDGLASSGLGSGDVAALRARMAPRLLTPGTTAGEPVHVLSALEAPSPLWDEDEEAAREALSASLSLLLRLVGRDPDPARSREHVLLAHLAERRLRARRAAGLEELLADLADPPIAAVGALGVDEFFAPKERQALARELNTLLASPTFATWRKGAPLDVAAWLAPQAGSGGGKTPAVIVSVAHLDDDERLLVLGLLFDQLLSWVRGLPGTSDLRALVVFDEVFGFLPPHPANPPTKRPLLALLKQARAFGVGVVLATQNPMDLDYKALSNAGAWFVGRLQTDADRERVVEGLSGADGGAGGVGAAALSATLKALPPRTFFVRDVHMQPPSFLAETRFSLSWLRGPVTRREIGRLVRSISPPPPPAPAPDPTRATPRPTRDSLDPGSKQPDPRADSLDVRSKQPDPRADSLDARSKQPDPRADSLDARSKQPDPRADSLDPRLAPPAPKRASPGPSSPAQRAAVGPGGTVVLDPRHAPPAPQPARRSGAARAEAGARAPTPPPAAAAPPPPPEGWRSLYAHAPAAAPEGFRYIPWVAASVIAHLRDTKLGVALNRSQLLAAPLLPDGRPDLSRVARLDASLLATAPAAGARFAELPAPLAKRATAQAAARALREHAYRTTEAAVAVHKELGLAQDDGEPLEAFAARCRAAAARLAAAEQQQVVGRFAPRIARLGERIAVAKARYGEAEAEVAALPGAVGAALLGLVAGRDTARRAGTQRDKAAAKLERARQEWTEADAALRDLHAAQAAELAALEQLPLRAGEGIETKRLVPKKNDVEVAFVALAWAATLAGPA